MTSCVYTHHYTRRERYAAAVNHLMHGKSDFTIIARGKDGERGYYITFGKI